MIFENEFDNYTLLPRHSELTSRSEIDLSVDYGGGLVVSNPLIASPMSSVTEMEMAVAIAELGGIGCLHRYLEAAEQITQINIVKNHTLPVLAAISSKKNIQLEILLKTRVDGLIIDVAHGDTSACIDLVKYIRDAGFTRPIISGNIVTPAAAHRLREAGVTAFRVGIGAGHACITRKVTGIGRNQLIAISEIRDVGLPILSCGGIRNSGDIVKCLAAGATGVIIGRLFSTTLESSATRFSGKVIYAGMASYFAEEERERRTNEPRENYAQSCAEGEHQFLEETGSLRDTVYNLCGGIRAGLAYLGVRSIAELHSTDLEWEDINGRRVLL